MDLSDGFDAHTHLDFPEFDADRDEVVARARAAGVSSWVIAGSNPERWDRTEAIARQTGGIAVLGVHPWDTATMEHAERDRWLADLAGRKLLAVGEVGFDSLYAKDAASRMRQRTAFRAQLALARERDLPVVVHCVRAYPELVVLLEQDGVSRRGGMVHAWSGPPELIDRVIALGLAVSFGPLVLRDRARKARASVPRVPLRSLLLETDCPNMKPLGVERGEPAHLVDVAVEVARLRGEALPELWKTAAENARALFGIARR